MRVGPPRGLTKATPTLLTAADASAADPVKRRLSVRVPMWGRRRRSIHDDPCRPLGITLSRPTLFNGRVPARFRLKGRIYGSVDQAERVGPPAGGLTMG